MTKVQLRRLAFRASRDLSLVPVLHDALLEHPEIGPRFEQSIEWAEKFTRESLARGVREAYLIVLNPSFLSRRIEKRRRDYGSLFSIYGRARFDTFRSLFERLQMQHRPEQIVPVYATNPRRYEEAAR